MTNISSMELNEVRPFFSLAMKRLVALDPEEDSRIDAGYLDDGAELAGGAGQYNGEDEEDNDHF